ncbi:Predicted nucleic acid-binding protein, contains PIN domain [Rhizobium sp. RU35A]|uniref:type II toxin-antitoxin system VapC family toxin n=1 Tax=Rhizobium sp. RU35A TaxID=1907414 RepID=UPI0009569264|nr:PIN domain-containing protein [Rhizobium sp. RU35A]SIR07072.1 Predicted nucleic acid-binding protein, contains PIN domain [Rhizobium sp. RU35A]
MTVGHRLYLDTNALILLNEGDGAARRVMEQIVTVAASKPAPILMTSALTLSELLVKPYRDRQIQLINAYRSWFGGLSWLEILPVSHDALDLASLLRATRPGLKLPDGIHMATALVAGASGFVSADRGIHTLDQIVHPVLGHLPYSPLAVIRPDEPTLTTLLESLTA